MNVSKILARKGRRVFTIKSSATLAAAASLLSKRHVGALVVTGADGSITGIISERDIVQALGHKGAAALALPIAKAMTGTVVTCAESSTIIQIMNKMTRGRFRHMPVIQRGDLAGIVSICGQVPPCGPRGYANERPRYRRIDCPRGKTKTTTRRYRCERWCSIEIFGKSAHRQ